MHIHELDSYNLNDAVKFHNRLNPRLWDANEHLKPEVREKLLEIAADFQEFLGVSDLEVEDITISGSNAAYSYTPHSDIDLHLVVKKPELCNDVYTELFNSKKYQYNDQHNIRVRGADVELYVQPADEPHVSLGIYSVLNNKWIQVPRRKRAAVEHSEVRLKYEDLKARIEAAIASDDLDRMNAVSKKIKEMRQAGLDAHGEFGPENLAFKMLRTQGDIGKLFDAKNRAKDQLLSLKEREKQKQYVRYGFTEEGSTPDGVSPTTCMFLNEQDSEGILKSFIESTAKKLGIERMPKLVFHKDDGWSTNEHSFGMYQPESHTLHVSLDDRHILDILRTTAHELAHCRQHELDPLPVDAGETGSRWENEAHAVAGIIMRNFADEHPEYFDMEPLEESETLDEGLKGRAAAAALAACIASGCATNMSGGKIAASAADVARTVNTARKINSTTVKADIQQEILNLFRALGGDANAQNISRVYSLLKEASGYIPTKAQAKDPRFKTALTVDIKPGQTGKEANKLNLSVGPQGEPALLAKDLANQLREFVETGKYSKGHGYGYTPKTQEPGGVEDDLGNQEATGPEFPPQMPPGTTKIDVTDLTDWYRLGMDISDMDDADPEDYNQGPPQTVVVFPSDAAEQDYLKQFKRLGLKTHDMDPDVKGGEDVTGKHLREAEQLDEVKMSPSALRDFASSPEAQGIRVGFEAEMIFPGLGGDDGQGESEPDYDYDERAYSIDDIINFFEYDDYGYGLSEREARNLREQLDEAWMEYFDDALMSEWESDQFNQVKDYIERNDWDEAEQIREYLSTEYPNEDIDKIIKAAREATSTKNTPPEYLEAANAVAQALDDRAEESIDNQDDDYDRALDEFRDEFSGVTEEDWLRENYRYMSDVSSAFDITWPYMRHDSGDGDEFNEYEAEQLADDLSHDLGVYTKVSSGYHSTKRDDKMWIFEPDSSLEGNPGDMPVEIVSPPMPLDQGLVKLREFFKWAKNHDAYTNDSTGFHMGVSLPTKGGNVDFLKLALFLGDEHVLKEFGRQANHFTEAAMKKIRNKIKQNPGQIDNAMTLLRNGLIELANKSLSKTVGSEKNPGFGKYTSINPKGNYIEFRSAGGEDYSEDVDKLENTMLRYARAMTIAANPSAERREYYKKLYKLIAPEGNNTALKLFSQYASGEISADELKKQWANATLEKEAPEEQQTSTWKVYDKATGQALPGYQYSGYTEAQALALAKQAMSPGSSWLGFKQMFNDKYELRNVSKSTGKWAIINRDTGETLEVIDSENRGDVSDIATEKYFSQGIDYYIEPVPADTPKPKLSRRAELAKRIKDKPYTQASYHVRLKAPTDPENYQAVGTVVQASGPGDAIEKARLKWNINSFGWKPEEYVATLTTDNAPSNQQVQTSQTLQPGQHWEIYSINTGTALKRLEHTNRAAAAEEARTWIRMNNGNVEDFAIRPAGGTTQVNSTPAGADVQWRVINRRTGDSSLITAPSRFRANAIVMDLARRMGVEADEFDIEPYTASATQEVPQGTPVERREPTQVTTDTGIPMWEIYARSSNGRVTTFPDHNQTSAWSTAQQWLRDQGLPESAWNQYSVRPLMQEQPVS